MASFSDRDELARPSITLRFKMSALFADLLDVSKTAGGIVFGAAISWFATRYSDAIRERRADFERRKKYAATLGMLIGTIEMNLQGMRAIHEESRGILRSLEIVGHYVPRITCKLHFSHLSNILAELIGSGCPHGVVLDVMGVIQKLESVDAKMHSLNQVQTDPGSFSADGGWTIELLAQVVQRDTDPSGECYKRLEVDLESLINHRRKEMVAIENFYEVYALRSYIFKSH